MCGIFGAFANHELSEQDLETLRAAHLVQKHRGPDANGEYLSEDRKVFLAHHRLSIQDLDARSNQPFRSGHHVIVFNGEIYNVRSLQEELRTSGVTLRTNSDTEVIVELYKREGVPSLKKLRGMFAFAIFDEEEKTLFCARDRIGEKPLPYSETEKGFVFASEIPALLKTGWVKQDIDETVISLFFSGHFKHIPDPCSIWKDLSKLMPGSSLFVREGKVEKRERYYSLPTTSKSVSASKVREAVIEAVKLTTISDVPISLLLSGGTDSSIIASVLKRELNTPFQAFAFGKNAEDPELRRARRVARHLDIPLEEVILPDAKEKALEIMRLLMQQYGEPLGLLPLTYSTLLMWEIKKAGFKVVLTGNGADELFYGYTSHGRTLLVSHLLQLLPIKNSSLKRWLLKRSLQKRKIAWQTSTLTSFLNSWKDFFNELEDGLYIDYSNVFALFVENAHSIVMSADITGMNQSLEVRSPFLDYRLVEMGISIPASKKIPHFFDRSGASFKAILKEAFAKDLPPEIFSNPKIGFGGNIREEYFFPGENPPLQFQKWAYQEWKKLW